MLRVKKIKLLNGKETSFSLEKGEIVQISGPNGTGKSLLMKSLTRLIPSTWAEYEIDGKAASDWKLEALRTHLLYLPPQVVFDHELTVSEFLDEPFELAQYKDFKKSFEPRDHLTDLSKKMDLLSSGQKQAAALLRAMSLKAQVLLLDEPFGHIDQAKRQTFLNLLGQWMGPDKAIVIISHDVVSFPQFSIREFQL